jgi:hypothetical protein
MRGDRNAGCDRCIQRHHSPVSCMRSQAIYCIVTRGLSPLRDILCISQCDQNIPLCDNRDDAPISKRQGSTHVIHHGGVVSPTLSFRMTAVWGIYRAPWLLKRGCYRAPAHRPFANCPKMTAANPIALIMVHPINAMGRFPDPGLSE